jgi:hypothetical protein
VLEPSFERGLDPDSFACRKGLGLDAALERAKVLARRSAWVLKSDIERCFQSIDHRVLKDFLARKFKDARLLDLLNRIIDHGGEGGIGLPIGSLTSQWFANIYLFLGNKNGKPRVTLRARRTDNPQPSLIGGVSCRLGSFPGDPQAASAATAQPRRQSSSGSPTASA